MVHAINCGADGAPNSFTNFKNSALAIGAQLKAAAQSSPSPSGYGYGTPTASIPSPTASPAPAGGKTIEVIVGGTGNLSFTPSRVSAAPQATVTFIFHVKNHTVTQSSFSAPCMPLTDNTTGTRIGFNSGYMPVGADATDFPTWSLTVNDTSPIWAYCAQAGHCGSGMVFAINSDESSGRSFTAFQKLAKTLNGTSTAGNSTSSNNGTSTSGGTGNGAMSNSVGGGLVIALFAALVGSLL